MNAITTRKRVFKIALLVLVLVMGNMIQSLGQAVWTTADYNKALWMTTRFYGAQRSGDNNWVLAGHLPAGVNAALTGKAFRADYNQADGVDLSGGWHDCGDHVKFGQTQYYSAYLVLKGYAEFTAGYDDKYSHNYAGYIAANNYTWEGSGHDPNCIPDVLDEMKHETDYIIKCTPNSSTFWYQVGNGGAGGDHCEWVTAVKMQTYAPGCGGNTDNGTPGTRRPSCKNPNDGMMASFAGATLALMARVYQPYDPTYAALCLTHSVNAYNYARTRLTSTVGTCFGGFYGAPDASNAKNAFVCCCAELYNTTGNTAYRTEAIGWEGDLTVNAGWSFDYANVGEIGLYCLAQLGNASALTRFNNRVAGNPTGSVTTGHFSSAGNRNGAGVYTGGGTWGALRYNGNSAFMLSLFLKLNNATITAGNKTTVTNLIYKDVDYIMGSNSPKRSYIVGFAPAAGGPFLTPLYPHHRGAYLRDDNPGNGVVIPLPTKNQQLGALVGGARDGTYNDDRGNYTTSEVCIDYNAGLVGALAYIRSQRDPVSGSCQTCRTPDIGANLSTCSGTIFPLTLTDASTTGSIPSGVTYTWKRVEPTPVVNPVGTIGASAKIRTIASSDCPSFPCKIVVVRDSTGGCSRTDTVTITSSITTPIITGPLALCDPAFYNITPTNVASFPGGTTWQWAVDYTGGTTYNNITGETNSTLSNVRTAGRYRLTATAGSCNSNANVVVTSTLPTPVDGCIGSAGNVTLSIVNPGLNGTNYNWYTTPSGPTLATVSSGTNTNTTSITVNVASTTTYYVQDMSAVNATVGPYFPSTPTTYGSGANVGADNQVETRFEAIGNYTITTLYIPYRLWSAGEAAKLATFEIVDDATGTVVSTSPQYTGALASGSVSGEGVYIVRFNVSIPIAGGTVGSPMVYRIRFSGSSNSGNPHLFSDNADPFDGSMPLNWASYVDNQGGNTMRIIGSRIYTNFTTNRYGFFVGFNISAGASCDRLPVIARVSASCTSAPVELISFYGERTEGRAILNWATISETNNDYFNIERSLDGQNFEVIGTTDGMGTKVGLTLYSFADEDVTSAKTYYRLTQVDFDGESTHSGVIAVEAVTTKLEVAVAPNPFTNSTDLFISSFDADKAKVTVTDLSGRILYSGTHSTNIATSLGQNMPSGVYILQVSLGDQVKTVRIVKQ